MSILDESYRKFEKFGSRLVIDYDQPNDQRNGHLSNHSNGHSSYDSNGHPNNNHLPPWFNLKKFNKIKQISHQYFFAIFFAHLSGLLILVFIRSIYQTLNTTGKSKNLQTTFYRYLNTCLHVKKWYEGNIWSSEDPAFKSLQMVKSMHRTTSNLQNRGRSNDSVKAISMRDMTLTQFAFVGLLILYPDKYGFSTRKRDIEVMIYFWSVIGYMLGIKDEYNLFIGDYETVHNRCRIILKENFLPLLIENRTDSNDMARRIVVSSNQYIYGLKYGSYMKFILQTLGMDYKYPLSNVERFWYWTTKLFIQNLYKITIIRLILNYLLRLSLFTLQFSFVQRIKLERLRQMDES